LIAVYNFAATAIYYFCDYIIVNKTLKVINGDLK